MTSFFRFISILYFSFLVTPLYAGSYFVFYSYDGTVNLGNDTAIAIQYEYDGPSPLKEALIKYFDGPTDLEKELTGAQTYFKCSFDSVSYFNCGATEVFKSVKIENSIAYIELAGVPAAAASAETSYAISYSGLMDGMTLSAGRFDDGDTAIHDTVGLKYTAGAITAGIQRTDINYDATGTNDQEAMHLGVSFAVNENLSVSTGRQKVEIDTADEDEINTGVSASYTMGGMTLSIAMAEEENRGGSTAAADDVKGYNINLAFAF